jgi:hypothetical protein
MSISIYQKALGDAFAHLHPRIQQRFSLHAQAGTASIGTGVMDRVWHGSSLFRPCLQWGTRRNILFPEVGKAVPFTVENYAYLDEHGRETVTWCRTFQFPQRARRFDATMIYSPDRGTIVDYLGTKQHLAVDIALSVASNGGLRLRSGAQRLYLKAGGWALPRLLTGQAEVCEWYDEALDCYRISVVVSHDLFGPIFGYDGRFQATWQPIACPQAIPVHVRPLHTEMRS